MKRNWNNVLKYLICFVLGLSCFGQMNVYAQEEYEINDVNETEENYGSLTIKVSKNYEYAYEVLKLVNQERNNVGLPALTMDKDLLDAAMQRAAEISVYYGHTRPTGKSCFSACSKMSGENIAVWQNTPSFVMDSWMNSSGHKGNILNSSYCSIGVGCAYVNGIYYWVQCFSYDEPTIVFQPQNTFDTLTSVPYNKTFLNNSGVSFKVSNSTSEGNMIADGQKCYGSTKDYSLYITRQDYSFVGIVDNSCIEWSISNGANVKVNDISVTVTPSDVGQYILSARFGDGDNRVDANNTVNFTDHEWSDWEVIQQPTTTNEGMEQRICKTCNKKEQKTLPKSTIEGQSMYRLYNPNSGEHFYTSNVGEKNHLVNVGWIYEKIGWTAPKFSDYPVYRLYNANGGEHHYTMNKAEKNYLVSVGWNDEGIGWYSADPKDSSSIPLLREYNPNAFANNHNYTTSKPEHNWLIGLGWLDEGMAWYALS